MARIAGINIEDSKRVVVGLTMIFGIGKSVAEKILIDLKIKKDKKVKDLDQDEIDSINEYIADKVKVEGDLRTEISANIRRLKDISAYRGTRHSKNLPVRGQRTKTNARTKRGKKVTVGSGRKKGLEKT
jgi:small subunit ribosomal protein S13